MIIEKNGRLYGKGKGLGGSFITNSNIFSDFEEFEMDWIFTQARVRKLSDEQNKRRQQIRIDCINRQNKSKAIFRTIYIVLSFISIFGLFILSALLH